MYNDLYTTQTSGSLFSSTLMWSIIILVIALAATVCLFVIFLNKKNENKFKGFLGWLYDFLNFKRFAIELLLKVTYVFFAIYLTLYSFVAIASSFLSFLIILIFGNFILRISYEMIMLTISICSNVRDINKKLK